MHCVSRIHRFERVALAALLALGASAPVVRAQSRAPRDTLTRLERFGRNALYGTAMGLAFAGVDQWQNDPPEWGHGWSGYGKRAASNVGEFYIQEGVTEGLAAIMKRPVIYTRCKCGDDTNRRVRWALRGAVTDQMPDGSHPIAVPRIVGAYVGSFAQAAWRPNDSGSSRTQIALVNGTVSLAIGAVDQSLSRIQVAIELARATCY